MLSVEKGFQVFIYGLMVTSVTKGATQKLPKEIKIVMTIHWKALEEDFLMVPLVFRCINFLGKMSIFLKKP
jgi:hypothetical protein